MSSPDYLIIRLPEVGTLVLDTATGRTGEYRGLSEGELTDVSAWLRPPGGGKEWEAKPEQIIPVGGEA